MHARAHTHAHTKVDFSLKFVLLTMLVSFMYQMAKESLITLSNVLTQAYTKLEKYEQLPENYNSNFKMYWDLLPNSI